MELVSKAGAFLSYGDVRLGQGREAARQYLAKNLEIAQEMEQKIRASANTTHLAVPSE
jgi:recombination protein RecA